MPLVRLKSLNMALKRIQKFNQDCELQLLKLKYRLMQPDGFSFSQGTCHLFYEDWSAQTVLNEALPVWVCGDLHLQNFGQWQETLLAYAQKYSLLMEADYREFCDENAQADWCTLDPSPLDSCSVLFHTSLGRPRRYKSRRRIDTG